MTEIFETFDAAFNVGVVMLGLCVRVCALFNPTKTTDREHDNIFGLNQFYTIFLHSHQHWLFILATN